MRWAAGGDIPLAVEGPGLIDCHLYEQSGKLEVKADWAAFEVRSLLDHEVAVIG